LSQLDAQMQLFVQMSLKCYPADAVESSATDQRRWYDALCEEFAVLRPQGVMVTNDFVQGADSHQVPIRRYQVGRQTTKVQIVYAHGGGFVVGGLDSHDDICAELAHCSGVDLVAVDYRLAPEFNYPDDINDCLAVVDRLLADGHQLILVGDSAGGTLSACVANARCQFTPSQLLGQVLIYPALAQGVDTPSMNEHAFAPLLSRADMEYYLPIRVGDGLPPTHDPLYWPMQGSDLAQLPVTHLFPAEIDPLCDDCELYADALKDAGVEVVNHLSAGQGLVHCYLRARHVSDKASNCFNEICEAIRQLAKVNG
jgi:acetyl esterase